MEGENLMFGKCDKCGREVEIFPVDDMEGCCICRENSQVNAIGPDSTRDKTGKIGFETWAKEVKKETGINRTKLKGEKDVNVYKQ